MKKIEKEKLLKHLEGKGDLVRLDEARQDPLSATKSSHLPREELLLLFRLNGDKGVEIRAPEGKGGKILFGVPPCEARAVDLLDLTFLKDRIDPYYERKRRENVLFVLACNKPRSTCFCTSFGYGPFSGKYGDVFMVDIGDNLLVDPVTEKGSKALEGLELEEATPSDLEKMESLKRSAEGAITTVNIEGISEKLKKMFLDEIWADLAFKCVNCGACTYVCPTCYCFDIQDVERTNWGYRERVWDSCMFPIYSLETSGHNPRPTGVERMRNRIMHKFSYYPELYGEYGCVGCGRCIRACPVNFDIREALETLKEVEVAA